MAPPAPPRTSPTSTPGPRSTCLGPAGSASIRRRDCSRAKELYGFRASTPMRDGLRRTVDWYREHQQWTERVRSGEYREFYEKQYGRLD